MQKLKNLIIKSKSIYEKTNNFLNQHWLVIFLTVSGLFFFKLFSGLWNYVNTQEYLNIHNQIFVMSLFCFISVYFMKSTVLWFLIPFIIVRLVDFHEVFLSFQDYFFNKSIFSHLFENLASKDINVIIISFFLIYMIVVLLFLITYKLIKNKWHLKSSFLFITLFITFLSFPMF